MSLVSPPDVTGLTTSETLVAVSKYLVQAPAEGLEWALSFQHPLAKGYPLTNVFQVLLLAFSYLFLIFVLTKIMKRQDKPVDVYYVALFHNVNLTALSLYMFVEIVRQAYLNGYSLFGNGIDEKDPKAVGMANVIWVFFASKVLEFIDTIIMVLKKNFRQVTFLHLYHHASIFVVWWITFYYGPGGEAYFSAALNSLVHVVMYGYYLWATFARKLEEGEKPRFYHPGFYRPYITRMQLTQFVLDFIQASYDLWIGQDCKYPRGAVVMLWWYMISMLALFGNFYIKAYGGKKDRKIKEKKSE